MLGLKRSGIAERLIIDNPKILLQQFTHLVDRRCLCMPHFGTQPNQSIMTPVNTGHASIQRFKKLIMVPGEYLEGNADQ
ncbi:MULTISPECIES: hypothetical protein [Burkholderia]|jgi:hypothetical protein|uniref:Uncharacterized protein n=3 Tax=Pseudomonadota TaxID=1224 RepID=A0AAP1VDK6_9BURK|nr:MULTISPECIES: hypothetical protein [Burkholderia]MBH9693966.1 hypothetical protein [Burkholderia contaminans]MBK1906269.1 hypothetical protein [Burkholderia contaminans]MBK1914318.1 hypothetical protein [Burkholderia contaminans]MBK1928175.1 hypothetical protein [Burkholderia contaminans]MBK1936234.1 hypothetical protein [Burkholderia contaminans]